MTVTITNGIRYRNRTVVVFLWSECDRAVFSYINRTMRHRDDLWFTWSERHPIDFSYR